MHIFTGLPSFAATVKIVLNWDVGGGGFSDIETDNIIELADYRDEELCG